ncbi:hypothetical protein [Pseudoxanthomonas sp. z9]|uniref:hypothetical protein n=1 Tax=Pseudoxanthomonas sp. z9 TaxID=2584942 RepID=UPI0015E8D71A|nr:hypothetical protein [Pseudoxanthomonas sp. z9]
MKSATRHMLLLAGMLCLWASAYSLGRDAVRERPAPHGQTTPSNPPGAITVPAGHTAGSAPAGSPRVASATAIATPMLGPETGAAARLAIRHPPRP